MRYRIAKPTSDTLFVYAMGRYDREHDTGNKDLLKAMRSAHIDTIAVDMHDLPGIVPSGFTRIGVPIYSCDYRPGAYLRQLKQPVLQNRDQYKKIVAGGFSHGGYAQALMEAADCARKQNVIDGLALFMPNVFFHSGAVYNTVRDLRRFAAQQALGGTLDFREWEPWVEYRSPFEGDKPETSASRIQYRTPWNVFYSYLQPFGGYISPDCPITVTSAAEVMPAIDVPTTILYGERDTVLQDLPTIMYNNLPRRSRHSLIELPGTPHDWRDEPDIVPYVGSVMVSCVQELAAAT